MKIRPLVILLFTSLVLCLGGCVDVGTDPGPGVVEDVSEPLVEVCSEEEQQTYRCRDDYEEVQICKEVTMGEFVWDTIDFCGEGEGCFESPLNALPACTPKFDCFKMVYNLIDCDSASQLKASERNECRNGVERLAVDASYKDVYDCYYREGCDSSEELEPTECVLENCGTLLAECVYNEEGDEEVESPSPGGEEVNKNPPDLGGDAPVNDEMDVMMSTTPEDVIEPEDPVEPPVAPGATAPCSGDYITCVAECVPSCMTECASSDEGPVTDFDQGTCEQACPIDCAFDCVSAEEGMDPLAMLSTGLCVQRCSNIKGISLQACLLQDCPDVITPCIQAGPTGSSEPVECGDTFTCLFEAITGNGVPATFACTEEASQENLDSAMALLNCVAQQTTDKGTCPWAGANTWVQHVTAEVDCLSGVCGEALYACPVPLLSSK